MLCQATAYAEEEDGPQLACPGPSLAPMLDKIPDRTGSYISVKAHQFDARKMGMATAQDEVELRRADQLLTTELLQYDTQTETITMPGRVFYEDSVMYISGTSAQYSFLDEGGSFLDVDYGLVGSSARGSATEVIGFFGRSLHTAHAAIYDLPGRNTGVDAESQRA